MFNLLSKNCIRCGAFHFPLNPNPNDFICGSAE